MKIFFQLGQVCKKLFGENEVIQTQKTQVVEIVKIILFRDAIKENRKLFEYVRFFLNTIWLKMYHHEFLRTKNIEVHFEKSLSC